MINMKIYRKIMFVVYCIAFFEMLTPNAFAYIDVSATAYVVQIIAGIVVVAGTIAGVVISSLKKKLKDKTGIDLDHKEVEDDIEIYDEAEGKKE